MFQYPFSFKNNSPTIFFFSPDKKYLSLLIYLSLHTIERVACSDERENLSGRATSLENVSEIQTTEIPLSQGASE